MIGFRRFIQGGTSDSLRRRYVAVCGGLALILAVCADPARGQNEPSGQEQAAGPEEKPFIYFLFGGGGVIGVLCTTPILVLSFVAMALILDNLFAIRKSNFVPTGLAEELHSLIANGSYSQAEQQCKLRPSLLSDIALSGLKEVRLSYSAVEKAMEDTSQNLAVRIIRKIEFLSVVANIAVMFGLFGTVVGLVIAFKRLADAQGVAHASDLAGGIYLAMMTTVEGLAVAIPCVAAYAWFKHRAENLSADAATMAEYAFAGFKRARATRRSEAASGTA